MKKLLIQQLCLAAIYLAFLPLGAQSFLPSPYPHRIILSWEGDPAHTQAVSWRSDTSMQQGFAEIALADASPDFRLHTDTFPAVTTPFSHKGVEAHYHSVNFTDLKPNTRYAYRVGSPDYWSEWFHFSTASKEAVPFSFIYFGDAQNELKSMWSRAIREAALLAPKARFMLHAGDLVNRADNDAEWGEWFHAGGWLFGMMPSIATPGNHEYARVENSEERELTPHWRPTFAFPQNGPPGLEETVYYLDYQGVRFISLNSMAMYTDTAHARLQKEWLEEVLAHNSQKWTIITHHHPIHSAGQGRDNPQFRAAFQPLYETYGVDLVLQGHDHTYARGGNQASGLRVKKNSGPVYVVSVSGPKMYESALSDWMDRVAINTQLFQIIDISGDELTFRAYTVTGELYDAFSLRKQPNGSNTFYDEIPDGIPQRISLPQRIQNRITPQAREDFHQRFLKFKARTAIRK
ncbi:MAG: metallophosphoesterase family protein [Bacteroidetes bacterium]|nr:MAG: metallophosphoesterase family protein [Bacteroidota bacterium]